MLTVRGIKPSVEGYLRTRRIILHPVFITMQLLIAIWINYKGEVFAILKIDFVKFSSGLLRNRHRHYRKCDIADDYCGCAQKENVEAQFKTSVLDFSSWTSCGGLVALFLSRASEHWQPDAVVALNAPVTDVYYNVRDVSRWGKEVKAKGEPNTDIWRFRFTCWCPVTSDVPLHNNAERLSARRDLYGASFNRARSERPRAAACVADAQGRPANYQLFDTSYVCRDTDSHLLHHECHTNEPVYIKVER